MKKYGPIVLLICLLTGMLFFTSCNKDKDDVEVITVDGKAAIALEMRAEGDSKTVTVRSSKSWTVEATNWIVFEPNSGQANRDVTVKISVGANEGEERLGSVVFTVPSAEFAMVSVIQPGRPLN